eukprot:GHVL01042693.1.p1 GENE.GHVL01042693.1~~GHVL01042693.1.p1  ORF type:complete len:555 (+),score=112.21 GHVL01042693.1:1699-3363(+)
MMTAYNIYSKQQLVDLDKELSTKQSNLKEMEDLIRSNLKFDEIMKYHEEGIEQLVKNNLVRMNLRTLETKLTSLLSEVDKIQLVPFSLEELEELNVHRTIQEAREDADKSWFNPEYSDHLDVVNEYTKTIASLYQKVLEAVKKEPSSHIVFTSVYITQEAKKIRDRLDDLKRQMEEPMEKKLINAALRWMQWVQELQYIWSIEYHQLFEVFSNFKKALIPSYIGDLMNGGLVKKMKNVEADLTGVAAHLRKKADDNQNFGLIGLRMDELKHDIKMNIGTIRFLGVARELIAFYRKMKEKLMTAVMLSSESKNEDLRQILVELEQGRHVYETKFNKVLEWNKKKPPPDFPDSPKTIQKFKSELRRANEPLLPKVTEKAALVKQLNIDVTETATKKAAMMDRLYPVKSSLKTEKDKSKHVVNVEATRALLEDKKRLIQILQSPKESIKGSALKWVEFLGGVQALMDRCNSGKYEELLEECSEFKTNREKYTIGERIMTQFLAKMTARPAPKPGVFNDDWEDDEQLIEDLLKKENEIEALGLPMTLLDGFKSLHSHH